MANCTTLEIMDIPTDDVSITHIEIVSSNSAQATVGESVVFRVVLTNPTAGELTRKSRLYINGASYQDSSSAPIASMQSVTVDYNYTFTNTDAGTFTICGESILPDASAPTSYPTIPGTGILCASIPVVPVSTIGCADGDTVCKLIEWIKTHPGETGFGLLAMLAFLYLASKSTSKKKGSGNYYR